MKIQRAICGKKICFRQLTGQDLTSEYLSWLNDPVASKYSRRRYRKTSKKDMVDYFENFDWKTGAIFAIIDKESGQHIGNIAITKIDKIQKTGELAVLIGDSKSRGKGFGGEAWRLMTQYGFGVLGLRKLIAGTSNPAMEKILINQGWVKEGVLREAFFAGNNKYLDEKVFGLLKKEFSNNQKKCEF